MTIPYTYYLHHRPTGKSYYGAQWGKDVHPDNLWKTYFTSSGKIKELIDEYGIESFDVEVRQTFDDPDKAILWEAKVIRRMNMPIDDKWINQAYVINNHCAMSHNQEIRDKISKTLTGRKRSPEAIAKTIAKQTGRKNTEKAKRKMSEKQLAAGGYGPKQHTAESKKRMSIALTGRTLSEEHKKHISMAAKNDWLKRKETGWSRSAESIEQGAAKRRGIARTTEDKLKISKGKVGKKRKYLPDGSFIMVDPANL